MITEAKSTTIHSSTSPILAGEKCSRLTKPDKDGKEKKVTNWVIVHDTVLEKGFMG